MHAIYMVTFTINIPPMLAYIPYMDPMGNEDDLRRVETRPSCSISPAGLMFPLKKCD